MTDVTFLIPNYEQVAKKIYDIIKESKKKYFECVFIKLPNQLVSKIIKEDFSEVKDELIIYAKKYHDKKNVKKLVDQLNKTWETHSKFFFNFVEKITGSPMKKRYTAYVTDIIRANYEMDSVIWIDECHDKKKVCLIICEELFHLHYWSLFKKNIKNIQKPWENNDFWEISETIPEFIFSKKEFMEEFGLSKEEVYRNYPFIDKRKKELENHWDNRKSFMDFISLINKPYLKIKDET